MLNVSLILETEELDKLRAKAKSLGVSVSAYVRQVLRDSLRRDPEARDAKLLRAMRAFVPTLAEAFGKTQKADTELTEKLAKVLLERYDKEV